MNKHQAGIVLALISILSAVIGGMVNYIWLNDVIPPREYNYNAFSPRYQDVYVVTSDTKLVPNRWHVDTLLTDTVFIISEYKQ